jgi:hypothetical protein
MIGFFIRHGIKHYRFTKTTHRWSERVTDGACYEQLQQLKSEMGITSAIGLFRCASVGGPMMVGFIHPRILLPTTNFAADELRFILRHELVHYKRKDLYFKALVLVANAMHWFNPIMYMIARAIGTQCEMSCDAEVVQSTDIDTRQQYGETIIGVVKYQARLRTVLASNFYGGRNGMKKRLYSIMDTRKKRAGMLVVCLMVFSVMATGVLFAVQEQQNTPPYDALLDGEADLPESPGLDDVVDLPETVDATDADATDLPETTETVEATDLPETQEIPPANWFAPFQESYQPAAGANVPDSDYGRANPATGCSVECCPPPMPGVNWHTRYSPDTGVMSLYECGTVFSRIIFGNYAVHHLFDTDEAFLAHMAEYGIPDVGAWIAHRARIQDQQRGVYAAAEARGEEGIDSVWAALDSGTLGSQPVMYKGNAFFRAYRIDEPLPRNSDMGPR